MTKNVELKVLDSRLTDEAVGWGLPSYGTSGSAGLDLRACIDEPLVIPVGSPSVLVGTGVAIYLRDPTIAGFLLPRSGLGHKQGLVLGNGTGLIDSDYQGEIKVSVWNRGQQDITINPGDRIAQYVILPVLQVGFDIVDSFDEASERDQAGFGHTGVK